MIYDTECCAGNDKMTLENANRILKNKTFLTELSRIEALEKERIFCRHNLEHFLSVARIALILCKQKGIDAEPDLIYSAALLHDIGRAEQYENNVAHEIAGEKISAEILEEINAGENFRNKVLKLVLSHRKNGSKEQLEQIFYEADKKSRPCFLCKAFDECNWSSEKKNSGLEF